MVPAPPPLPTRFPCWCRAVYSWGGESQRDLGFIEGDLIECLNVGDGSWWTGRLRRNKTVGVFPSNFVEVLPENFKPVTRTVSPLPKTHPPGSINGSVQKAKPKAFRKPFEAYSKAPHYTTAKQPEVIRNVPKRQGSTMSFQKDPEQEEKDKILEKLGRTPSPNPMQQQQHMQQYNQRAPSPNPQYDTQYDAQYDEQYDAQYDARAPSPSPMAQYDHRRTPSPNPMSRYNPRAASPNPMNNHYYDRRAPSPNPPQHDYIYRGHSPAPRPMSHYIPRDPSPQPPPPMHRYTTYNRNPSPHPPSPQPMHYDDARGPSPQPSLHYGSRAPSPAMSMYKPYRPGSTEPRADSPPPPPPPPHRTVITNRGGSNESQRSHQNGQAQNQQPLTPREQSPSSPSLGQEGFTPSPLREAMDGVIEQLDALALPQRGNSIQPAPAPVDPWCPESFDMVQHRSRRRAQTQVRPQSSFSTPHQDSGYGSFNGDSPQRSSRPALPSHESDLPQLSNYVNRMESRLKKMHQQHTVTASASASASADTNMVDDRESMPPPPPPKGQPYERPKSSMGREAERGIRKLKSTYELGRSALLNRTSTTKTTSTNASSGSRSTATDSSFETTTTSRSLMSGTSAGGISATSAGSYAKKLGGRARSALGFREGDEDNELDRPITPFSGVSYHPSHSTSHQIRPKSQAGLQDDGMHSVGGLVQPGVTKPKRTNFIKRILEATKTGVASNRNSIAISSGTTLPQMDRSFLNELGGTSSGLAVLGKGHDTARDMGLGGAIDWVQVRRDVNRSNTLSKNELDERRDRCQMLDYPAINPIQEMYDHCEGDEGADGLSLHESTNFSALNLSQVDKNSRFLSSLPATTTAVTLATNYVCRPYRNDVQRLRAIFTWVAEKINWEEEFEALVDTKRVIQSKRACAEEYAVLVHEMCTAVGIHSEVVRGYLKNPSEIPEMGLMPRSNHWWNAVLVDKEWRMIDCSLASASNPRRGLYSSTTSSSADSWWFLTRPIEICWTHIPEHHGQQHMCPPMAHEVLLALPCVCPPYFKNSLALVDYNTALTRIEDLEMVHVKFNVPSDVEVAAEVETRAYTRDADGDFFESGEIVKKRALAQADWYNGVKRYTVKALLPGDEGTGVLKIYAGKRGLMHSIKDIPHPLAFGVPIIHTGENPPYEFVMRHPTPHAQRHDIYVVQPQCQRLALNNTFVFAIRQHPSLTTSETTPPPSNASGAASPIPFARPGSALSMMSSNPSTSNSSGYSGATGTGTGKKPAKLAIQTPGGKILRLMRKEDRKTAGKFPGSEEEPSDGGTWETIIKCSEKGVWRGLVLADRTARWCVFAEWVCIG